MAHVFPNDWIVMNFFSYLIHHSFLAGCMPWKVGMQQLELCHVDLFDYDYEHRIA
jgi:hypothetical protein